MNKYMEFRNMMTTTTSGKEEAILNLGSWNEVVLYGDQFLSIIIIVSYC